MELKTLIENLIKKIVVQPDQVQVIENEGEETLIFEVKVAPEDMGRVIGKKGKNIEALRTIVLSLGVKHKKRCLLQLLEADDEPGQSRKNDSSEPTES